MRHSLLILVSLGVVACSGDSTGGATGPSHHDGSAVRIVPGASTKGSHAFAPDTIRVSRAASGALVWHNADNTLHRLTGVFFEGLPVNVPAGDSLVVPLQGMGGGSFEYHCAIHPTMVGRVVITP